MKLTLNTVRRRIWIFAVATSMLMTACATPIEYNGPTHEQLHSIVCSTNHTGKGIGKGMDRAVWHITNLYDCATRSIYIPYQLWTASSWNGSKSEPCMHSADNEFVVNENSATRIQGPLTWRHPEDGKSYQVWRREKVNGTKKQLFSCHDNGIGRLFDNRRSRYYAPGRCKFPAGFGWRLHERRQCVDTAIELVDITLNEKNELTQLKFKWWTNNHLDHIYAYAPNRSMTHAWQQPGFSN